MPVMSTLWPACWARRNSRWLTGKVTYIGSWLTMTVSGPLCGVTTFPFVIFVLPTLPVIGEVMLA